MSVESFKKNLWESAILEAFKGICVADAVTVAPSRVDGVKAIFNTVSIENGVQDYAGTVSYEGIETVAKELLFDKKKYFAYKLEDVDAIQLAGDVMMPLANDMAYDLKRIIDSAVFTEAAEAATNKFESEAIAKASDAYDNIVDLGTALDEKDVPENDRFVICRPEYANILAKDTRVIDNANVLPNGIVQGMDVNGMQIVKTTACPAGKIIVMHKSAVGYGKQLEKLEALRLESSFSDAVRGLLVFGVEALRPDAIAVMDYTME